MEKGVDIKCIKELPGHFDIKTTRGYLHLAKDKLVKYPEPVGQPECGDIKSAGLYPRNGNIEKRNRKSNKIKESKYIWMRRYTCYRKP